MAAPLNIALHQRPRLSRAARLRFDRHSQCFVLLSPERALRLNQSASAIISRCTGASTVQQIVEALLVAHFGEAPPADVEASTAQVTSDVLQLLTALHSRRLLLLEPIS